MLLIKMALRNLTRHKRRVLITASIIALGITLFLIYDAIQIGLNKLSFNNIKDLETGDLQIINQNYWSEREDLPLDDLIIEDKKLSRVIREVPYFKSMALQLKFRANLNNGVDELPVVVSGMSSKEYKEVFMIEDYLVEGRVYDTGYEVVLGKRLAGLMELGVGDYLTLKFKTEGGSFNTIDAQITGLIHTNNPDVNNNLVYIPLQLAQQALNLEGKVSQIVVRLDEEGVGDEAINYLSGKLASIDTDLEVYSWREFAGEVIAMSRVETAEKMVMMFIILLIAAVGIVNTIILSSLERVEEIGMMKALGLREKEIVLLFMVEAGGIGFVGGIMGSFFAIIGILYLNIVGIDLTAFIGDIGDWGLPIMGRLYGYWNPISFLFVISFGILISLLASILPAYWAARKDPVEAIQGRR